jgi:hypothetical protein
MIIEISLILYYSWQDELRAPYPATSYEGLLLNRNAYSRPPILRYHVQEGEIVGPR